MTLPAANAARIPAPVMILAGGTGGHIFPGLAVAAALRARDVPVVWLGAEGGMETRLVPQHDLPIETIAISGLRGKGAGALLRAPLRVLAAVRGAARVLAQHRPRAVVSFGGFAAGPGGIAAAMAGVPLLVHEQNRAPGLTNRVLSRLAKAVMTGFPDSFPGRETVVGNPVRTVIAAVPPPGSRAVCDDGVMRILVLGGSQGARALNDALPKALQGWRASGHARRFEVRHQCGEKLRTEAEQAYAAAGFRVGAALSGDAEVAVEPFIADMATAYAWADLVVCRAGALTLAEVCAVGVASVLIPLPTAVDDHQTRNALYLVDAGAARLLKQDEGLVPALTAAIDAIGSDPVLRDGMAVAARGLARPDAAERVADIVLREARA